MKISCKCVNLWLNFWRMWKQFRKEHPDDGELTINLLYKEPCHDF